ncbi:MAG: DNA cytosine methyltransferase [Fluviicola sp.]|nr:MAG: DNA cytosine methyltransferase [Fluviicola sp.]
MNTTRQWLVSDVDYQQRDAVGLRELALFAGAGGGILGGLLLGWRTVCAVEREPYPIAVLAARQDDGCLHPFPIWDDVRTFDGTEWRGLVDVVSGGFPCGDISCAGKGAGITGEQSGLWVEMARIIREVRPRFVFVENSPMLTSRGLGIVLGDLAGMGFDAEWGVLGADDAGAPHHRKRIWIVAAHPDRRRHWRLQPRRRLGTGGSDTARAQDDGAERMLAGWGSRAWESQPRVCRDSDGLAARSHRLKALGNGQAPAVAALAWRLLTKRGGWR